MDKHFSLPGIKALYYVPCNKLPSDLTHMCAARVPIVLYADRTEIPFVKEPTCEIETTNENKGKKQSVTLSFQSVIVIPEEEALAFVVTDENDLSYLIGIKEEPYPLITCLKSFGSPDGDSNTLSVEVSFVQTNACIEVTLAEKPS